MAIVANIRYNAKLNNDNDARNLRITHTPQAIRNNQFNIYTGKFDTRPSVVSTPVNNQRVSSTFSNSGKTFYSFTK